MVLIIAFACVHIGQVLIFCDNQLAYFNILRNYTLTLLERDKLAKKF